MSANIPAHYYTQYAQNIDFLLQQKDSRLGGAVRTGSHSGEKASPVDQIGKIEMNDVTTRFAAMGRVDAPLSRRWVFPVSSDLPQLIDSFDKLKLLMDPSSQYVTNAVMAANRRKDRHIITNFFADAKTGVNAGDTEQFGTTVTTSGGQNVSVSVGGTTSGLNVAKLKEAKRRLIEANVDVKTEELFCAVTSDEQDDLLNEIQVINGDYGKLAARFDDKGNLLAFMGFQFIHTELLGTGTDDASGTSTAVPVWAKGGMYYGNWQSNVTDISQRKDLQGLPWQAYLMMTGGATRIEKERVIRVWCR